jgi:hypothetical protein
VSERGVGVVRGERDPGQQQASPGFGQAARQLSRGAQVTERKAQQCLQLVSSGEERGRRSGQDTPRRLDGGQRIADLPAGSLDLGPVKQGKVLEGGTPMLGYRQRPLGEAFCSV